MWIFAKNPDGTGSFLSAVAHRDHPDSLLVRARKRQHLESAFPNFNVDEENAADYRFRAVIPRWAVQDYLLEVVETLDYQSHVKEELTAKDNAFYDAMLSCWTALYKLQSRFDRRPAWKTGSTGATGWGYRDDKFYQSFEWPDKWDNDDLLEPGDPEAVLNNLDRALHPEDWVEEEVVPEPEAFVQGDDGESFLVGYARHITHDGGLSTACGISATNLQKPRADASLCKGCEKTRNPKLSPWAKAGGAPATDETPKTEFLHGAANHIITADADQALCGVRRNGVASSRAWASLCPVCEDRRQQQGLPSPEPSTPTSATTSTGS